MREALDYLYDQESQLDCQGFNVDPNWTKSEVIRIAIQMGWEGSKMLEVQKLFYFWNDKEFELGCSTPGKLFLDALKTIGVEARDYPEHKMWLLDYSQIDAIKNHPVVNECRGLVMGYDGQIIRKGFTRFYNLGENGVDTFDFENSIAFEKADGSIMFVYWCEPTQQWEIGTRGTAFAEGPNEWHGTFRGFMLAAMGRTESEFQQSCTALNKDLTYLFEAVGPDNRIVTPYETNHLVYLAVIVKDLNNTHFAKLEGIPDEDDAKWFREYMHWNVRLIRSYKFNTQEDCMIALGELKGLEEGYVVYNLKTGMRVKIKNAVYLAAHRLRGNGLTVNAICELVALNEQDEYIAVFPEDTHKFEPAIVKFNEMILVLELNYYRYKDLENQKEFALAVKDLPLACVMFKARSSGETVHHVFNQFPVSRRAEWIKERLV